GARGGGELAQQWQDPGQAGRRRPPRRARGGRRNRRGRDVSHRVGGGRALGTGRLRGGRPVGGGGRQGFGGGGRVGGGRRHRLGRRHRRRAAEEVAEALERRRRRVDPPVVADPIVGAVGVEIDEGGDGGMGRHPVVGLAEPGGLL